MKSIIPTPILVLEGSNIFAGAYKGFMDATGQDVDSTYLLYVGGGTAALRGSMEGLFIKMYNSVTKEERLEGWRKVFQERIGDKINPKELEAFVQEYMEEEDARFLGKDPVWEGTKMFAQSLPVSGIEMILGYALGYVAGKMFS